MCWSLEVSIITFVFELVGVTFLLIRSYYSNIPEIKNQKYAVIAFISVLVVELIGKYITFINNEKNIYKMLLLLEILLWIKPDEIINIQESIEGKCSSRNRLLTSILFPTVMIQACIDCWLMSTIDDEKINKTRLKFISNISTFFFIMNLLSWFLGEAFDFQLTSIRNSNFSSFYNTVTCTYKGIYSYM